MKEEVNEKLKNVLKKVHTCALEEENGSSEHISEYVTSDEIEELCTELGFNINEVKARYPWS